MSVCTEEGQNNRRSKKEKEKREKMSTERKVVRKFQLDYDVNDDIEQGRRRLFSVRWWLFSGHEMTPFSNKITYEKGRKVLQAIIFSSLGRHRELDI